MIRTVRRWRADRIERQTSLIRQPTLLVWGEEDTHIPVSEAFRLRDAIPNSRLIVFRRCGHLPPTESPEKFVEVVAEFARPGTSAEQRDKQRGNLRSVK
jgi:pimeloyl-ACP methyl ester carboxylesterase